MKYQWSQINLKAATVAGIMLRLAFDILHTKPQQIYLLIMSKKNQPKNKATAISTKISPAAKLELKKEELLAKNHESIADINNSQDFNKEPSLAAPAPYIKLSNKWEFQFEAIAGTKHLNSTPVVPCQDAAISGIYPKPFVIVADGAGSSAMSDIGAQTVVTSLSRLLETLEQEVSGLLDQSNQTAEQSRRFALMLTKHARGVLIDLAKMQRRPVKDFRCTLLLAILGKANLLWLKVGDGALVKEEIRVLPDDSRELILETLGDVGKGDFANETTFIDEHLRVEDVKSGILSSNNISGLAAMSDGSALALVSHDGTKVAARISKWFNDLRSGKLKKHIITSSFYDSDFSRRAMGDDCSIALVARELNVISQITG
ncbi:MAG: PP2C family serine/threonine-protein phosphatase [Cyclobacteriaceae bacterium]|nr:PP2C family serine/threonine-protein phosphatase [Cyclobacteriaceae bacterium]